LLYLWAEVIYKVKTVSSTMGTVKKVWRAYLGVDAIMIILWIIFVIIYYTIGEDKGLPCQAGDIIPKTRHLLVNYSYLWFIVVISIIFIVAVVALGAYFLFLVGKSNSQRRNQQRQVVLQLTIIVLCSFPPMFLIKTALLLWAGLSNGVVPLIVFSLLEILPSYVLLYYIYPWVAGSGSTLIATRSGSTVSHSAKSTVNTKASSAPSRDAAASDMQMASVNATQDGEAVSSTDSMGQLEADAADA